MLLENYLKNEKQRVVLNGLSSSWEEILAGVPQGSVMEPLLSHIYIYIYIYINDLPHDIFNL